MQQPITLSILVAGAVLAALVATLGLAGAVHLTSRRPHGYLHLIFYAMLLVVALSILLSGRNLNDSNTALGLSDPEALVRHPLVTIAQRLASLLVLTVAGERIITQWLRRDKSVHAPSLLLVSFIVFWTGSVAAPALFGAHPHLSHDYVYPLVIGSAALLASASERELSFRAARNALFVFMVGGLLLIPLRPTLVLDSAYTQGLLPGVPRLAGLAAHAVSLGVLAQLALLCLLASPYRRTWLNRLAWATCLLVLLLAQSKTAWISSVLCLVCVLAVRKGPGWWRRVGDPLRPEVGIASVLAFMGAVVLAVAVLMFGELDVRLQNFFDSSQGAQLASMTGRDLIWAIAWDEWQQHPVFGYGPTLWNESYRASIGMPNATHAHNQFMDTLSRSGTVGAVALVFYGLVLLVLSLRYTRASGGLTLALFIVLVSRAMSEVPLLLFGYGPELITHVLLLMALAASASEVRMRSAQLKAAPPRAHFAPTRHPLTAVRIKS